MSLNITQICPKCPKKPLDLASVVIKLEKVYNFSLSLGVFTSQIYHDSRVIQGSPVPRFDGGKGHIRVLSTKIWPKMTLSRVLEKFLIPFKIVMRVLVFLNFCTIYTGFFANSSSL